MNYFFSRRKELHSKFSKDWFWETVNVCFFFFTGINLRFYWVIIPNINIYSLKYRQDISLEFTPCSLSGTRSWNLWKYNLKVILQNSSKDFYIFFPWMIRNNIREFLRKFPLEMLKNKISKDFIIFSHISGKILWNPRRETLFELCSRYWQKFCRWIIPNATL